MSGQSTSSHHGIAHVTRQLTYGQVSGMHLVYYPHILLTCIQLVQDMAGPSDFTQIQRNKDDHLDRSQVVKGKRPIKVSEKAKYVHT